MTHDPMCQTARNTEMSEAFCDCALIARVREDERRKVPTVCTPCWYQDHTCEWPDRCRCGVCADQRSRAAALRDAKRAMRATCYHDDPDEWCMFVAAIEAFANRGTEPLQSGGERAYDDRELDAKRRAFNELRGLDEEIAMNKEQADRILRAWINPGRNPLSHRKMQDRLREEWPVLAQALDAAAGITR